MGARGLEIHVAQYGWKLLLFGVSFMTKNIVYQQFHEISSYLYQFLPKTLRNVNKCCLDNKLFILSVFDNFVLRYKESSIFLGL